MMLRLAGLLAVFSCCCGIGFCEAEKLRERRRETEASLRFWELMAEELKGTRQSPGELTRRMLERPETREIPFLEELYRRAEEGIPFERMVQDSLKSHPLPEPLGGEWIRLSAEIGTRPMETEQTAIRLFLNRVQMLSAERMEDERRKHGLYCRAGILAGLLLVIMLW